MAWFKDWFNTPYYHLLYGERDHVEAEKFINNLLDYLNPEKGSVFLDLACGKGRHALDIARKNFKVYGVDLSLESIEFAKKSECDNLKFEVHDMRETFKEDYFDYVLNLFTSFGYFDTHEDNLKTLIAVTNDLKQEGVFIQDYFNSNVVLANMKPSENKLISGIDFHITKEIKDSNIIKTISFKDNGESYRFQEKVKLLSFNDFENLYSNAGLKVIDVFGDYQLNPFNQNTSERLLLVSKKI
ncbi:MAG: methyltransferase domain-containing protein [Bacteroidia bacterium]